MNDPLPLIGRTRALVNHLTANLHKAAGQDHHTRFVTDGKRGSQFDVRMVAPDGPTNYVARVTVELLPPEQCRAELGSDWIGPEPEDTNA